MLWSLVDHPAPERFDTRDTQTEMVPPPTLGVNAAHGPHRSFCSPVSPCENPPMPAPAPVQDHERGIVTVTAGVIVLSFDALLIRLAAAGAWEVIFWRGALITLSLVVFLVVSGRWNDFGRFLSFGRAGLYTALLQGAGSGLFVLAVSHTSVANTVVLIATAPLFAAIASHFFLKERIEPHTWAASIAVLLGVAIVFGSALEWREGLGNLYAVLAAVCLGANLTLLRRHHAMPRIPLVATSGVVTAAIALPFGSPLLISSESYVVLGIMGMVQMPVALILITAGTRYLSSPEVSLFLLLETLLGPVWVWMALGERITVETLAGGSVIVLTLLFHSLRRMRRLSGNGTRRR